MPKEFIKQYSSQGYKKDLPKTITDRYDFICFDRDMISSKEESKEVAELLYTDCYTRQRVQYHVGTYCFMPSSQGDGGINFRCVALNKNGEKYILKSRIGYSEDGRTFTAEHEEESGVVEVTMNNLDEFLAKVKLEKIKVKELQPVSRLLAFKNVLSFGNDDQQLNEDEKKLAEAYIVAKRIEEFDYTFFPNDFNEFIKGAYFKYGEKISLENGPEDRTCIKFHEFSNKTTTAAFPDKITEKKFPNRLFRYYAVLQQQIVAEEEQEQNIQKIVEQLNQSPRFYEEVLALLRKQTAEEQKTTGVDKANSAFFSLRK